MKGRSLLDMDVDLQFSQKLFPKPHNLFHVCQLAPQRAVLARPCHSLVLVWLHYVCPWSQGNGQRCGALKKLRRVCPFIASTYTLSLRTVMSPARKIRSIFWTCLHLPLTSERAADLGELRMVLGLVWEMAVWRRNSGAPEEDQPGIWWVWGWSLLSLLIFSFKVV